ncbi:putative holin-like toxin [Lacticaseibacillus paracasei]|nr:putative holin-like toxin [Lacticaseibacillus paracasei]MEA0974026.1 putative holin-like toxin [Lacticaseibacillus paracasei]
MSVAEAITLMLAFGSFVLSLVNTFVTLVKAIQDNQILLSVICSARPPLSIGENCIRN